MYWEAEESQLNLNVLRRVERRRGEGGLGVWVRVDSQESNLQWRSLPEQV